MPFCCLPLLHSAKLRSNGESRFSFPLLFLGFASTTIVSKHTTCYIEREALRRVWIPDISGTWEQDNQAASRVHVPGRRKSKPSRVSHGAVERRSTSSSSILIKKASVAAAATTQVASGVQNYYYWDLTPRCLHILASPRSCSAIRDRYSAPCHRQRWLLILHSRPTNSFASVGVQKCCGKGARRADYIITTEYPSHALMFLLPFPSNLPLLWIIRPTFVCFKRLLWRRPRNYDNSDGANWAEERTKLECLG